MDQRHRPKHVAHHLHVRLSADDLGASSDKFRSGRQGRLDGRPGGGGCAKDASGGTPRPDRAQGSC